MIPDATVERVREAADIVSIVGEHVKLKRSGADYRGPCPFHHGKNPNFSVSARHGTYHCFKCGVKGDVFEFVRQQMGVDFVEAVRIVGGKSGVPVEEVASARDDAPDPREPLWEVNAAAAAFFRRTLLESEEAAAARRYLASREIGDDLAERFQIGYAPARRAMQMHLNVAGYDDARLLDAGLLVQRDGETTVFPRLRDRVVFPILDVQGRTVGFGGRTLAESEGVAKYLNSPETPVFSKRRLLFNLHSARNAIRKADAAIVVEGYFDVVRLVGAGIEHVVAGQGTALTGEQAEAIARLTKNVFLVYDSDDAGQKATFRAAHELLRVGAAVRVVTLPDGQDPDSFVRATGAAGMQSALDAALDVFERQVQILERRGWFADLHRRRRAIDRLLPTIRAASDALTRDLYVARVAEAAGVDKALILAEVSAGEQRDRARGRGPAPARDAGAAPASASPDERAESWPRPTMRTRSAWEIRRFGRHQADPPLSAPGVPRRVRASGLAAERALVHEMLHARELVERVAEQRAPGSFRDPASRAIFSALLAHADASVDALAAALPPPAVRVMEALLEPRGGDAEPRAVVEGALARLRVRELSERLDDIDAATALATDAEKDALIREKMQIGKEVQSLGGAGFRHFGKSRD